MASAERIKDVFLRAVEQTSPAERQACLDQACQGDPELRRQVESLLLAHDQAGDFLGPESILPAAGTAAEKPGDTIGRYQLLELIGEGGFGTVWMAEQQEPVRRRVALKLVKPGMDTRQVLTRFEAERQALAMMDHPCIARVFDGGATDTGRPFFVMELVRGVRITDYCDAQKLSTRQRLLLVIQVCQAVQHAHQKGIIHRDLKPSNILITTVDGAPVPKVIDFGVAKAMETRVTGLTTLTRRHEVIGTPSYMSPEQAGLGGLDVDTRSDIYGLGVLLYELLTGQTPLAQAELDRASLDEVLRLIRERDPLKPSTCWSTLTREQAATIAAQRQIEPSRLNRLLSGDLDWIVMKALEKDRRRRYETAGALAADLTRHLNLEPVTARPPSNFYRLQRAWRRHQTVFTSALLLALVLVAASAVSLWLAIRAKRAESLAEHRLAVSEAISQSLAEMAEHSFRVGAMQNHVPVFALDNAGREAAIDLSERMLAFNREVHGPEAPETLTAMDHLAQTFEQARRWAEAIKLREQSLAVLEEKGGPDAEVVAARERLVNVYILSGRSPDATALLARTLELETNSSAYLRLGTWQAWLGQDVAYETTRRRFLERAEKMAASAMTGRVDVAFLERAAKIYCLRPASDAAGSSKALELAQQAVDLAGTNGFLRWDQLSLAMAQYRMGQYADAQRLLSIVEAAMARDRPEARGTAEFFRVMCLCRLNQPAEARNVFTQAEARMPKWPADERKPFTDLEHYETEVLIRWLAYKEAKGLLGN
jgi:serine/threonine protein kinase